MRIVTLFSICIIAFVGDTTGMVLNSTRCISGLIFLPEMGNTSRSVAEPKHNLAKGCRVIK